MSMFGFVFLFDVKTKVVADVGTADLSFGHKVQCLSSSFVALVRFMVDR